MSTYRLIYKMPNESEVEIIVTGSCFTEGWRSSGRTQEEWTDLMKRFQVRIEKDEKEKSKADKFLFIFWLSD